MQETYVGCDLDAPSTAATVPSISFCFVCEKPRGLTCFS